MAEVQHCPACDEEYVGGVPACVDCGGPLTAGPLQRYEGQPAPSAGPAPAESALDRLVARLPGKQADQVVRVLLMENIPCRVLCEGQGKTYTAGQPPSEPFAVSLPVEIYVRAEALEAAQDIVASFEQDDLIGEQWSASEGEADAETIPLPMVGDDASRVDPADDYADAAPEPQGTSVVTAVLVVAVVLGLLFLFGR